ncbi:MAG: OmpA family protein [Bacteroidota bacterium]|nr:OmpA family protein [Bacteroidota bacterium]
MNKIFKGLLFCGLITACVPQRKLDELQVKYNDCQTSQKNCADQLHLTKNDLETCNDDRGKLKTRMLSLQADSLECYTALNRTQKLYEQSETTSQKIIDNNRYENEKLAKELNAKNEALKNKESELNEKEASLMLAQNKNRDLASSLTQTENDLKSREQRVKELEAILKAKDSAVNALKLSIQKALGSFQNQGLTVEIRNGKVYVSMEEKLLFKSGSIIVDPKGESAILELAKALNQNGDVSILVEGHTDNVPMKSPTIKDNLDLSVLRATSIARILTTQGAVDPTRIMSAGRGEHFPVDTANTPEARAKNRRTEIILTPKLDELFSILGN